MASQRPAPVSEDSEEARALLQTRVALFWKVIFFIILLGSGLGLVGAVRKPGVDRPVELEAIVLACLHKDPAHRPQSAAELRRRIESCSVEPWDSARALAWCREYQPDLDGLTRQSTGDAMTITVDGANRL